MTDARVSRRIVLKFPPRLVDQPIVSNLVRKFDLEINILKASVTPTESGLMVLEVRGEEENCEKGMKYLEDLGISLQPLSKDVRRNEERCTHCGACLAVCPTGALAIRDRTSMRVEFDPSRCIGCELCVSACPPGAMEVHF